MAGTKVGGKRAVVTTKKRYGDSFYVVNGRKGGLVRVPKGFSKDRALASRAGKRGGYISKRGPAKVLEEKTLGFEEWQPPKKKWWQR